MRSLVEKTVISLSQIAPHYPSVPAGGIKKEIKKKKTKSVYYTSMATDRSAHICAGYLHKKSMREAILFDLFIFLC